MAERSRWAPGAATLADAARAISSVAFAGRSTETALREFAEIPQRTAVTAITLGSLRWYLRLAPAVDALLSRPRGVADEIRALLVVSAHQIEYSRNPPPLVAHSAVDASRILGQARASGLVNAVLRRFVAERATLLGTVDRHLAGRTAHPQWLVRLLQQTWPERIESILAANNEHPPLTLRVNLTRTTRERYLEELAAAGIGASPVSWAPAAICVQRPVAVAALPGFNEGVVSVQDAGAQLAATLLAAQPGMRVLDACAAPGGKTGHILERTPDIAEIVAVDADNARVGRITENLQRLGLEGGRVVAADIREPGSFRDSGAFERILVDAPCSSTGVIRRHPDIKLLRRPADIPAFAALQEQILGAAFRMLTPGGRLLYCTCSVLPQENQEVLERLLTSESSARVVPMPAAAGIAPGALDREIGIQLVPGCEAGSDGFYYACVEKATAAPARGCARAEPQQAHGVTATGPCNQRSP